MPSFWGSDSNKQEVIVTEREFAEKMLAKVVDVAVKFVTDAIVEPTLPSRDQWEKVLNGQWGEALKRMGVPTNEELAAKAPKDAYTAFRDWLARHPSHGPSEVWLDWAAANLINDPTIKPFLHPLDVASDEERAAADELVTETEDLGLYDEPSSVTTISINTRHPQDYELINHKDGTRWEIAEGEWRRIPGRA
jgi:hypothetical protein